jgi:hypothetical protein
MRFWNQQFASSGRRKMHNVARAKYDREAALVRCRALKIPRLDSISTDFS